MTGPTPYLVPGDSLKAVTGRRWTKIVTTATDSARVFVDMATGAAYAAKSWSSPNLASPLSPEDRDAYLRAAGLEPWGPVQGDPPTATSTEVPAASTRLTLLAGGGAVYVYPDLVDDPEVAAQVAIQRAVIDVTYPADETMVTRIDADKWPSIRWTLTEGGVTIVDTREDGAGDLRSLNQLKHDAVRYRPDPPPRPTAEGDE